MKNTKEHLKYKSGVHLYPDVSRKNIKWLSENDSLKQIQFDQRPSDKVFKQLNDKIFKSKPNVELRVFNFSTEPVDKWADLGFLKHLTDLQHLSLESADATDLDILENLTKLKSLFFACGDKNLSLGFLESLKELETLNLSGIYKEFDIVSKLDSVKTLGTPALKESQLDSILALNQLETLSIGNSGIKDLSGLLESNIKTLILTSLKSLRNLDFVSKMKELKSLSLAWLSNIEKLPTFNSKLEGISIDVLNRLKDISSITTAKNLERFVFYNPKLLEPKDFDILGRLDKLTKMLVLYERSDKKNKEIDKIIEKYKIGITGGNNV